MSDDFNPDDLDPGIRRLVTWLQDLGFQTTDSGDGTTKFAQGWTEECAMPFPHVAMVCSPYDMLTEADDLRSYLESAGVVLTPEGVEGPTLVASYDPADSSAILLLSHVADTDLPAHLPGD